ncbi:predicted protein [Nematostella vectensis]|uniref:Elongation factor 1-delta n=1 Tax=Nematostella vectensis TaxID=45351 RepID=A7SYL3_NEMVE|nr:predicted protein [Nematostella vectensis]|eukprot:XP_001623304.1 predicted protein [Nematostella vectensis]
MHETIWFDRYKFDEAEETYQAHLAGVVKTHGSSSASSSVREIAEARRKIQQTLSGAPGTPNSSTRGHHGHGHEGPEKRIAHLEEENKSLRKVTDDLTEMLKKLELRVAQLEEGKSADPPAKKPEEKPAAAKKEDDDDSDIDLFGSDDEEEAEEARQLREKRLAEYNAKKATKKPVIAKSNIIFDVKPWDDETDLKELENSVRSVAMDGLLWGASKLVEIAYGLKKLQITCVIEDAKVSTDDLIDKLCEFEDFIQSVDIVSFNKI